MCGNLHTKNLLKKMQYDEAITYTYDITSGVLAGEEKELFSYLGGNTVSKIYDCTGRI